MPYENSHISAERNWFVTGATGFIGREILRRLLRDPRHRIVVLVRDGRGKPARARVEALLDGLRMRHRAAQVEVCRGDVTATRFGLDDEAWNRLAAATTHIVHLAALTRFDAALEQARRYNVGSARNVLEFARAAQAAGGLRRLAHVSTAYVAGTRTDRVSAADIDPRGPFRNSYEQSKCEAETLVREQIGTLPLTIFRPSIVIGDSRSGEVTGFNTIYWSVRNYLRGVTTIIARPQTPLDLVPVDYVADAMLHILDRPQAEGQCYLLAGGDRTTVSLGQLAAECCRHFDSRPPRILPPVTFLPLRAAARLPSLPRRYKRFIDQAASYLPYFVQNPVFDTEATERILSGSGIRVPELPQYLANILDYCLAQGWGDDSPVLNRSRRRSDRSQSYPVAARRAGR